MGGASCRYAGKVLPKQQKPWYHKWDDANRKEVTQSMNDKVDQTIPLGHFRYSRRNRCNVETVYSLFSIAISCSKGTWTPSEDFWFIHHQEQADKFLGLESSKTELPDALECVSAGEVLLDKEFASVTVMELSWDKMSLALKELGWEFDPSNEFRELEETLNKNMAAAEEELNRKRQSRKHEET